MHVSYIEWLDWFVIVAPNDFRWVAIPAQDADQLIDDLQRMIEVRKRTTEKKQKETP